MKHKLLTILLSLIAVLCLCFAVSACDNGNSGNGGSDTEQSNPQNPDEGGEQNPDHVHSFINYIYNNDATCILDGTETATCSCGATDTRTRKDSALGHDFKTYISNGDATCLENGTETAQCIRCPEQDTREEQNSALGHKFETYVSNEDATCLENGTETAQCVRCSERDTREKQNSALRHNFQIQHEAKEATCAEAGHPAHQECDRCHVLTLSEEDYIPAQHIQYELMDEGYAVSGLSVTCLDKDIVIPETYMGKPVISIKPQVFDGCTWITSIALPSNMTTIGNSAFYGCTALKSVTFGENSKLISIGSSAFNGCTALKSVTFGENCKLTSIGSSAFYNCKNLTGMEIPRNITAIGTYAFYNCSFLATNISISQYVTSIGSDAFEGCSSLESITVDENNPNYSSQDGVLYNKAKTGIVHVPQAIKGAIIIPDGVTSIEYRAFSGCSGLTSITIPDSVTSIGSSAFSDCSGLTSITIPNSMTSIGGGAFFGCSDLTSIEIPNSVTSIGEQAFYDCSSLESITVDEGNKNYSSLDGILYNKVMTSFIHIPKALKGSVSISARITAIPESAFSNCKGMTQISIPSAVTSIGSCAFENCSSLESFMIPEGVTSIKNYTFSGCSELTNITIPDSVTSIGDSAFSGCSGLTSITIPDSVTEIGKEALCGCTGIKSITLPFVGSGNVQGLVLESFLSTLFGSSRYYYNSDSVPESLKTVVITGGESIGEGAFSYCRGLTSIILPDSITSIGYYAFEGCSGLTSIDIPKSVTSIEYGAFSDCSGLTSIEVAQGNPVYHSAGNCLIETKSKTLIAGCKTSIIPSDGSVTSIGEYAFYGCSGLTSIIIPDGVTEIGGAAFCYCSSLTNMTIPDSVTSIGEYAFSDCYKLVEVWNYSGLRIIAGRDSNGYVGYYAKQVYTTNEPSKQASTEDGYLFYEDEENAYLIAYRGDETNLTLPAKSPMGKNYQINQGAFYGYSELTSVTIPNGVISIGSSAFYWCSGLTSITIPDSVTSIGEYAFFGCSGLTSIEVAQGNPVYHSVGNCLIETDSKTLIAGCKTSIIPSDGSVTSIGEYAFYGCSGLTSVTIPNSVTSIGLQAFYNCSELKSVTIGDSVTSIGWYAFYRCSGLKSVYYMGTSNEWSRISIGSYNSNLTNATRYYYSAEENYDGEHWHYDPVTNQPVVWTKEDN